METESSSILLIQQACGTAETEIPDGEAEDGELFFARHSRF